MVKNPPEGCQDIIPYICYEDAPAAIDFLCKAFGFEERFRLPMPDGRIGHAELALGRSVLYLASPWQELGLTSPKNLPAQHAQIACYVADVDRHFERARAAGATIGTEPADMPYGDRSYRAVDLEGFRWIFATHVRDVSPEEIEKAMKGES